MNEKELFETLGVRIAYGNPGEDVYVDLMCCNIILVGPDNVNSKLVYAIKGIH